MGVDARVDPNHGRRMLAVAAVEIRLSMGVIGSTPCLLGDPSAAQSRWRARRPWLAPTFS